MIIKYPTGFYSDELKDFIQNTNVSYNISNNTPKKSTIIFAKIPDGVSGRKLLAKTFDRADLGSLVATSASGNDSAITNNKRLYEIGDLIEFTDTAIVAEKTLVLSNKVNIDHNLNYLDYNGMGLTVEEQMQIADGIKAEFDSLSVRVNQETAALSTLKADLSTYQKTKNETNKTISAINLTGNQGLSNILEKLNATVISLDSLIADTTAAIKEKNNLLVSLQANLRSLGALVK